MHYCYTWGPRFNFHFGQSVVRVSYQVFNFDLSCLILICSPTIVHTDFKPSKGFMQNGLCYYHFLLMWRHLISSWTLVLCLVDGKRVPSCYMGLTHIRGYHGVFHRTELFYVHSKVRHYNVIKKKQILRTLKKKEAIGILTTDNPNHLSLLRYYELDKPVKTQEWYWKKHKNVCLLW